MKFLKRPRRFAVGVAAFIGAGAGSLFAPSDAHAQVQCVVADLGDAAAARLRTRILGPDGVASRVEAALAGSPRAQAFPDAVADIRAAFALLRRGRIALRQTHHENDACQGTLAAFRPNEGSNGTIVVYDNGRGGIGLDATLVHESLHALHFSRSATLRRNAGSLHDITQASRWAQATDRPTRERGKNALLGVAWTEYWAYRQTQVFRNIDGGGDGRNPDSAARSNAVSMHLLRLRMYAHVDFNPGASHSFANAVRDGVTPVR